jgi:hypothetical protein
MRGPLRRVQEATAGRGFRRAHGNKDITSGTLKQGFDDPRDVPNGEILETVDTNHGIESLIPRNAVYEFQEPDAPLTIEPKAPGHLLIVTPQIRLNFEKLTGFRTSR